MLKKTDFVKIINDCKESGHEIKVRDVMFCLLKNVVEDSDVIYNSLFGKTDEDKCITNYEKSKPIRFLDKYIKANYNKEDNVKQTNADNGKKKKINEDDISFEENKAELIKMLKDIDDAVTDGLIEVKDAMKMKVDIRTKLNDKFGASEKSDEQRIVVVPPKFNHICEKTRTECWLQTKEFAMQHWGLIEDPNKNKDTETKQ